MNEVFMYDGFNGKLTKNYRKGHQTQHMLIIIATFSFMYWENHNLKESSCD